MSKAVGTRYPYIRVWGVMMGSLEFYIEDQQARAAAEGAPQNTIYKSIATDEHPAMWVTTEDILAANTRHRFEKECERLGIVSPWADMTF